MPQIPNYTQTRRPSVRFGGGDTAQPVVEPGGIALGRSIQDFGQSITGLGSDVAEHMKREQIKQNNLEVDDLTIKYKDGMLKIQQDYESKKGEEIVGDSEFIPRYLKMEESLRDELLKDVNNKHVSEKLVTRFNMGKINLQESMHSHVTKERDIYATQLYSGGVKMAANEMGANPHNDSLIEGAVIDIIFLTHKYATDNGLPDDQRDALLLENLTAGHVEVIGQRIDDGSAEDAEAYFWENKDQISGEAQGKILKALEASGQTQRTQILSDEAYDMFADDMKGGLAYVRENAAPEDRDEALRRIKNRYNEAKTIEKDGWDAAGLDVRGQYASQLADKNNPLTPTQIWDAIPLTEKLAMNPSELLNMESRVASDAAGKPIKTNMSVYFEVDDLIRRFPDEARELDLSKFAHAISSTDLKALNTLRHKDPKLLGTETSILKEGLLALNVDPADLLKDNGDGRKGRAFQNWVRNNLSPDYDKKELQETVNRGIIKVITDVGTFWDTSEFAYTAGDKFEVRGVPAADVDEMASAVQQLGLQTTTDNLQRAYALRESGMEITVENMMALSGADIPAANIPSYTNQSRDFPQAGSGG